MPDWDIIQQERKAWLDTLQVGDKVAVYSPYSYYRDNYSIQTISKITPTRMFDLENYNNRFNQEGRYRASTYTGNCEIVQLTHKIITIITQHDLASRIKNHIDAINLYELPVDKLEQIHKILFEKECKNE